MATVLRCSLLLALFATALARPGQRADQCGYAACPTTKPGMLNVHLVAHTHDDVGWLKTIDQYYYGKRNDIQKVGVQYILNSVIPELLKDPSKRFIWVETAFLWQWWGEQDEDLRTKVKGLVENGQLEIIGGGWSMNDEATTHYQCTIDQFTWGFRILEDLFGACGRPHIGWQIDPFGHSRETASMMAHMGFDGLFIARLDYQDKEIRLANKESELVWQASQNQGDSSSMFTHVLFNQYAPPPGFCFDIMCNDDPFIDSKRSPDYNVDTKVDSFLSYVRTQAESYNTNNVILTMGEDFFFQNANMYFKNLDKLIKYVNERQSSGSDVNVFYSTPSCYLKAVHEANLTWTTKQDDFFPYPNDANSYWTGYFTSRPTLKYFERKGNNLLQVVKQLYSLAELGPEQNWTEISSLREIMGVMQHHDAITGTEKQHVTDDYAMRLDMAMKNGHTTAETAINKLMAKSESSPAVVMAPCLLLNVSQCDASEHSDTFVVSVYNPLARSTSPFVRLPVPQSSYRVLDPQGAEVTTQLVPIPSTVLTIPGRESDATHELVFKAADLPALGFKAYYVEKIAGTAAASNPATNKFSIGNERLQVRVDPISGRLSGVSVGKVDIPVEQSFLYYEGFEGNNLEPQNRSSGAYVFRPKPQDAVPFDAPANVSSVQGPLVEEVHQTFSDWVSQVIRVYEGEDHVEFEWQVGPIPVMDNVGKEVISRFSTDWPTDGVFFTDSNGRETLQRKRDFRPTWTVNISEPVSGNYYPVTTAIGIKSGGSALAVLPDRAQGGSSVHDGEIELMVHRRLLKDDRFGVGEALSEIAFDVGLVARGRHILVLGSENNSPTVVAKTRQLSQSHMVLAPWLLLAPTQLTPQQWQQNYVMEYSGLTSALPDNVHLLTLEPWKDGRLLLRLEHFLERSDDPLLSSPATLKLEDLFSAFTVESAAETTLGGNQLLEESARLAWRVQSGGGEGRGGGQRGAPGPSNNKFSVTLEPMQIRTFLVQLAPRATGLKESKGSIAQIYEYFNSLSHNMFH